MTPYWHGFLDGVATICITVIALIASVLCHVLMSQKGKQ